MSGSWRLPRQVAIERFLKLPRMVGVCNILNHLKSYAVPYLNALVKSAFHIALQLYFEE